MRRWLSVILVLSAAVLSGCEEEPQRPAGARLVLEIGGDGPTLGEVLRKASPRVDRPMPKVPEPVPDPRDREEERRRDAQDSDAERFPSQPAIRVVELPEGWTLIRLCEHHLGDRERWREVAQLNGWSEDELRRLPARTQVKLPAR